MVESSDVIIVGGGAAGCAAAYYLALAGVKSTIIEREGIASQASGYSAGGLNPLQGAEIPGKLGQLAWESYCLHLKLWDELREDTGIDYDGRIVSSIKLAFQEPDLQELEETLDIFTAAAGGRLGEAAEYNAFEARRLEPGEVVALEPRAAANAICGLYTRGNAALDSRKYTLALAEAAKKRGASVRSGEIVGLESSGDRVTGGKAGRCLHPLRASIAGHGAVVAAGRTLAGSVHPGGPAEGRNPANGTSGKRRPA